MFIIANPQQQTSILGACSCNFTGKHSLVLNKGNCLELMEIENNSLRPYLTIPFYSSVVAMSPFVAKQETFLFVLFKNGKYALLGYDNEEVVTRSSGSVDTQRISEIGFFVMVDPSLAFISLYLERGFLTIIPVDKDRITLNAPYSVRIDERTILSLCQLDNGQFVTLSEDFKKNRSISSWYLERKELCRGHIRELVDEGSNLVVPVKGSGYMVFSKTSLTHTKDNKRNTINFGRAAIKAIVSIDDEGKQFLFGTDQGSIYYLEAGDEVTVEILGSTSIPSDLVYLDNGVCFLASKLGDSKLIKLTSTRTEHGNFLIHLDSFSNLGPILDFTLIDLEGKGQDTMIACCNAFNQGSLRVIRAGINFIPHVSFDMPTITKVWRLDSFIVLGLVDDTIAVKIDSQVEMIECEFQREASLLCFAAAGSYYQVCKESINITGTITKSIEHVAITCAIVSEDHIFVVSTDCIVHKYSLELDLVDEFVVDNDVTCVAAHNNEIAVGIWPTGVKLLKSNQEIPTTNIIRDAIFYEFDEVYLFLAESSGGVLVYKGTEQVANFSVGNSPAKFAFFQDGVVVCSDRPAIITMKRGKLMQTFINSAPITSFCSGSSIIVAEKDKVVIGKLGNMDVSQLHNREIQFKQTLRRIVRYGNRYVILAKDIDKSSVLFLDQELKIADTFNLEKDEIGESLCVFRDLVAAGTGFVTDPIEQVQKGRILLFSHKIQSSTEVGGCVYALGVVRNNLIASVGNMIRVYSMDDKFALVEICKRQGFVAPLMFSIHDNQILVGDLMKSASLYEFNDDSLEECFRDRHSSWVTSIAWFYNFYVVADHCGNIFFLENGQEKTFKQIGCFSVGDQINKMSIGTIFDKPQIIFGTVSGSVGTISECPEILAPIQAAILDNVRGHGNLDYEDSHKFKTERREMNLENVVDGNILGLYCKMGETRERVAETVGLPVNEIQNLIDTALQ